MFRVRSAWLSIWDRVVLSCSWNWLLRSSGNAGSEMRIAERNNRSDRLAILGSGVWVIVRSSRSEPLRGLMVRLWPSSLRGYVVWGLGLAGWSKESMERSRERLAVQRGHWMVQ